MIQVLIITSGSLGSDPSTGRHIYQAAEWQREQIRQRVGFNKTIYESDQLYLTLGRIRNLSDKIPFQFIATVSDSTAVTLRMLFVRARYCNLVPQIPNDSNWEARYQNLLGQWPTGFSDIATRAVLIDQNPIVQPLSFRIDATKLNYFAVEHRPDMNQFPINREIACAQAVLSGDLTDNMSRDRIMSAAFGWYYRY